MNGLETHLRELVAELVKAEVDRRLADQPPANDGAAAGEYMSTKEAAAFLGYSPLTLRHWRAAGEGPPHYGSGRMTRYRRADLVRWLAEQRRGKASP